MTRKSLCGATGWARTSTHWTWSCPQVLRLAWLTCHGARLGVCQASPPIWPLRGPSPTIPSSLVTGASLRQGRPTHMQAPYPSAVRAGTLNALEQVEASSAEPCLVRRRVAVGCAR